MLNDLADKSYLAAPDPASLPARAAALAARMGRRLATHPKSTLFYTPAENGSRVLTEWLHARIVRRSNRAGNRANTKGTK